MKIILTMNIPKLEFFQKKIVIHKLEWYFLMDLILTQVNIVNLKPQEWYTS